MSEGRPLLGVTMGDPSGTGPEIAVKALIRDDVCAVCRSIVIGDAAVMRQAARIVGAPVPVVAVESIEQAGHAGDSIEVLDLHNVNLDRLVFGKVDAMCGQAAYECVVKAAELALSGKVGAIVTSALHKEAMNLAGHDFPGHTELLAHLCGVKGTVMMLVAGTFRVSHVSTHVSLRDAIDRVKKDRILHVTRLTVDAVRRMGVAEPRVALAGLNPHSGEGGMFGHEEELEIRPAAAEGLSEGMGLVGPIPPDTVFYRMKRGEYDAVVAMYHDQGHIPTKVLAFDEGVNVTLGLPIIRTSVDHGTAFGKAGKGTARPDSMIAALKLAADMARQR